MPEDPTDCPPGWHGYTAPRSPPKLEGETLLRYQALRDARRRYARLVEETKQELATHEAKGTGKKATLHAYQNYLTEIDTQLAHLLQHGYTP